MKLTIREDITPAIAETARQMSEIDPLAALHMVTPMGTWDDVDAYASELLAAIPQGLQGKAGAALALKETLNIALGEVFEPAGVSMPPNAPKAAPGAALAAGDMVPAVSAGADSGVTGPAVPGRPKMSAVEFLGKQARAAKTNAMEFLGIK